MEAAGRLRGREPQITLADIVLDGIQPEGLRSAAAIELCRHIQQYGLLLGANQISSLQSLFEAMTDSRLKANVSLVIGSMRPDSRQTGERLRRYAPTFSPPAKQAAPAEAPKQDQGGSAR